MTGAATIGMVVLDIAVILLAARAGGLLFQRIGQPAVIGEIAAGIALGPTLLGALPGDPSAALFPADAGEVVTAIGDIGLVLFMFTVGWQLELRRVRRREQAAVLVSLSSIALPFALGLALAAYLHPAHRVVDGEPVPFAPFALFIGAALSITAFPVLARILRDLGLANTSLGALALSAAAVDDVIGWTLVAGALALLASADIWEYVLIVGETVLFVAVVAFVLKPLLHAVAAVRRPADEALFVLAALGGAYVTDAIGIHPAFGAFAVGVAMPRAENDGMADVWRGWGRAIGLLVPIYFVSAGMAVDVPGLRAADFAALVLIVAGACTGKFLGAFAGARAARIARRDAAAIGVLMNTRGVVEIVLLSVGRESGLIDDRLFTLFALMAIFTTLLTTPLLRALALPALGRTGGRPVPAS